MIFDKTGALANVKRHDYLRFGEEVYGGSLLHREHESHTGWNYDAAGNLLNDGVHTYTYDAENRISKVDGILAYVYDGRTAGQETTG